MITVQNIIDWASPHRLGNGTKRLRIGNDHIEFSIVGGDGLYGDFVNTFEVAVFNLDTDDYMTSFFFDDSDDGMVSSYVPGEELVRVIGQANNKNDFQVR
jgi:hypothetical protein